MKTITQRSTIRKICVPLFMAAVFIAAAAPKSFGSGLVRQCYPEFYDQDRDGYADLKGISASDPRFTYETDTLDCLSGNVSKAGDCDDNNKDIHPQRDEVGYNGIDDNCNGIADEPTFEYFARGNLNTATSFRISVFLNTVAAFNAAFANVLYVEVSYAKLSDSAHMISLPRTQVTSYGASYNALLTLKNLSPETVYMAKLTLYKKLGNNTYQAVSNESDAYYTMTDGPAGKPDTRMLIVLKGLKEYADSLAQKVGYRGAKIDGTRYGAAVGENWCTEFYAWISQPWMPGVAGFAYLQDLTAYFQSYNSYYPASEIPNLAQPGDYVPKDTDQDGGVNHVSMFLAYDASRDPVSIWTLEGNHGNKVAVVLRDFDYTRQLVNVGVARVWRPPVFVGLGYILSSMLHFDEP